MNPTDLETIFKTRLGAVQSSVQVSLFAADLARANLDLMHAALRETQTFAARAGAPTNARDAVIALYNLRLAEIAQLFPVFFTFESAFRSFAAARLSLAYGDDQWWTPVRDAVAQGRDPRTIHRLAGHPARRDVIDTLTHLVRGVGTGAAQLATSYDLLESGTLAHVERLIASHWSAIAAALRQPGSGAPLTGSTFNDRFRAVRLARNDAYHHRLIQRRTHIVTVAEQLLDMLDISLEARLRAVARTPLLPLSFNIPIASRHT